MRASATQKASRSFSESLRRSIAPLIRRVLLKEQLREGMASRALEFERMKCTASRRTQGSEGGMLWLEALIELKFITLSFSRSNLSIRAYPLVAIGQTVPCRAIRGKSSDSRQQYLNQQYPPPSYDSNHNHKHHHGNNST